MLLNVLLLNILEVEYYLHTWYSLTSLKRMKCDDIRCIQIHAFY